MTSIYLGTIAIEINNANFIILINRDELELQVTIKFETIMILGKVMCEGYSKQFQ